MDFLAGEAGITQFLDIGSGLPARGQVHEIAQAANKAARVAYADNDPAVNARGREVLAGTPLVAIADGDVRYPGHLLSERAVCGLLDLDRPVAVLMVAVLHFIADDQDPWPAVRWLTQRLAPGSFLVLSHVTGDQLPPSAVREAADVFSGALVRGTARPRGDIFRFFAGLDLLAPGLVNAAAWRPGREAATVDGPVLFWAGVARKLPPGRSAAPGTGRGVPAGDAGTGGAGSLPSRPPAASPSPSRFPGGRTTGQASPAGAAPGPLDPGPRRAAGSRHWRGARCRTHHQVKQEPGWQLRQPRPGELELTTPAHRTYRTGPEPHLA